MAITIDGTNGLTTDNAALKLDGTTLVVDDTNNRVGIGTTSPGSTLNLQAADCTIRLKDTGASDYALIGTDDDGTLSLYARTAAGVIDFRTNNTERMRITSSGNVGIGTSSPTATLDTYIGTGLTTFGDFANSVRVQGGNDANKYVPITFGGYGSYAPAAIAYLVTSGSGNTNGALVFGTRSVTTDTRPTERMRIDSSGYLYVNNMAVGGTANMHWSSANGQFFVTSSSRRFKHDIVDYDKGLAQVMQMQPKYFVYNEEPNQKQRVGFIAEDFHDLGMTEFVEYWKDENDQDVPSEIGYSNMVAICVKAIQELKAENDALKSRLDAVEALEARIAALEASNV